MDATLQELRRVRDGLNGEAAQRGELVKHLKDIKMKDQGPDVVVLTHLCHSLELPTATVAGGLKRAKLVEQIVPCWRKIFRLLEISSRASTGERWGEWRDGTASGAGEMKDQGPDVVVLTDFCHSLGLPAATVAGGLKRAEGVEHPSRDVDQSSVACLMGCSGILTLL